MDSSPSAVLNYEAKDAQSKELKKIKLKEINRAQIST